MPFTCGVVAGGDAVRFRFVDVASVLDLVLTSVSTFSDAEEAKSDEELEDVADGEGDRAAAVESDLPRAVVLESDVL